jgi:molecular chaperone GrpE
MLEQSYKEKEAKAEEYLDGWQRSRAEFANYKKRVLKEHTEIHQSARGEVIKIYLDIADDLERALQDRPEKGEANSWADGIEIIFQKLQTRFESEGIIPMNALGEEFDPNIHEALMKEESDEYESGQIIEVVQEGYWIGEKVLRPAVVRVAA